MKLILHLCVIIFNFLKETYIVFIVWTLNQNVCHCVHMKIILHFASHIVQCWRGCFSAALRGSFFEVNVYRMTQVHNSCQFVPRRVPGATELTYFLWQGWAITQRLCVCVWFHCSFRLSYLSASIPPSSTITSPLYYYYFSHPTLSPLLSHFLFFLPPLYVSLSPPWPPPISLHPFFPLSTATLGDRRERESSCCAVCFPAWLQGLLLPSHWKCGRLCFDRRVFIYLFVCVLLA